MVKKEPLKIELKNFQTPLGLCMQYKYVKTMIKIKQIDFKPHLALILANITFGIFNSVNFQPDNDLLRVVWE